MDNFEILDKTFEDIKKAGSFADTDFQDLEQKILACNPKSFKDPAITKLTSLAYSLDYDERVQTLIFNIVNYMSEKGVEAPCAHGCSDDCTFHKLEN